jgi:glycosyltransferase involved in cell wall biosynthesis
VTHRILHIIPSLDQAGAEKQLVLLAAGLPRDEFETHVCALTRGGPRQAELEAASIPVTLIGKRLKADPLAAWRLQRHVAQLRPQLVQTWLFAANAYGAAAALKAGVPHLVAGQRCVDPWKAWPQLAIERWVARRADRVVVNSQAVRDFYCQHGLPAGKMVTIPGGVPPAEPSDLSRADLLEELDLPADARLIGAVGRLWPQKRIKDLLWAADLCHLVRDNIWLLVIGDGPQRRQLERFVHLLQGEDYIRLLGERNDVGRILPHLDVLWLGSEYEGLPNAVMEAMAARVPVVATDIPGCRDLVVPGETGFLVPVGDRAARARATEKILSDPQLAKRLGEAGRQRMTDQFRVDQMIQRHVVMYREIFGG